MERVQKVEKGGVQKKEEEADDKERGSNEQTRGTSKG